MRCQNANRIWNERNCSGSPVTGDLGSINRWPPGLPPRPRRSPARRRWCLCCRASAAQTRPPARPRSSSRRGDSAGSAASCSRIYFMITNKYEMTTSAGESQSLLAFRARKHSPVATALRRRLGSPLRRGVDPAPLQHSHLPHTLPILLNPRSQVTGTTLHFIAGYLRFRSCIQSPRPHPPATAHLRSFRQHPQLALALRAAAAARRGAGSDGRGGVGWARRYQIGGAGSVGRGGVKLAGRGRLGGAWSSAWLTHPQHRRCVVHA
jgi:hypothetical protein